MSGSILAGVNLLESKSTIQMSSGSRKFFLYIRNDDGTPMTNLKFSLRETIRIYIFSFKLRRNTHGVGAKSNCSAQL